jgi:hypothetical protein
MSLQIWHAPRPCLRAPGMQDRCPACEVHSRPLRSAVRKLTLSGARRKMRRGQQAKLLPTRIADEGTRQPHAQTYQDSLSSPLHAASPLGYDASPGAARWLIGGSGVRDGQRGRRSEDDSAHVGNLEDDEEESAAMYTRDADAWCSLAARTRVGELKDAELRGSGSPQSSQSVLGGLDWSRTGASVPPDAFRV